MTNFNFRSIRDVVGHMQNRTDVQAEVFINNWSMTIHFYIGDNRHNIKEGGLVLTAENSYNSDRKVTKARWVNTKICKDGKKRRYNKRVVSFGDEAYDEVYEMLRYRINTGEVRSENVTVYREGE